MAEFYGTKHITEFMRGYVKHESRRIRLGGVRAKAVVFAIDAPPALSCLKAFSWADITVVIKRLNGNLMSIKSEIINAAFDNSIHGMIITDNTHMFGNITELYDMIPPEKDVLCVGAPAVSAFFKGEGDGTCTSAAVMKMLDYADVEYKGKTVAIIGKSHDVKVLSYVFMNRSASVFICPEASRETAKICANADILVTWQNKHCSVTSDFVNEHQIVIDLGAEGDCDMNDIEPFVQAVFLGSEQSFPELCDYIAAERVLKCADSILNSQN